MNRIPIPTLITALLLVVMLVVYWVTYEVRYSESVVKIRLGKPVATVRDPGLHFKWPPPIEYVKKLDNRFEVLEVKETEVQTADQQNIIVGVFAVWRIEDPLLYYKRLESETKARESLSSRVSETRAKILGQHRWSDLINLDQQRVDQSWDRVEADMLADLKSDIATEYGIELKRVGLRRVSLPEEATAKVLEAMQKERERLAEKFVKEGEALRESVKARAESERDSILAFAERKAREIESAGIRAAERIFARIPSEDTEFFNWLRTLEAIEAAFAGGRGTIFLGSEDPISRTIAAPPRSLMEGPASASNETDGREE